MSSSTRVQPRPCVDQKILGGFLQLNLGMEFRKGIVCHALPPLVDSSQVGDDGDGLLHVLDQGAGGGLRDDMLGTKTTSSGADGTNIEVLIKGNGDTQGRQQRHLPQLIWSENRSRTVGSGV